jgi:hypothetical protein
MELVNMEPAPHFQGADFSSWGFEIDNPCFKEGYLSGLLAAAVDDAMESDPPELAIVEDSSCRVLFPMQIELCLPLRGADEYVGWRCSLADLFSESGIFPIHSDDKAKIAEELRRIADTLTA